MLSFVIGLFTGPFGKIFTYGAIIIALVGVAWGWLKIHDHNIRIAALTEFNEKQKAETEKNNAEIRAKLDQIAGDARAATKALDDKVKAIGTGLKAVDDYLSSDQAKKDDRESSELLKRTIEELNKTLEQQ